MEVVKNFITDTIGLARYLEDNLPGPASDAFSLAERGEASKLISDLLGTTNPMDIAGDVNTLFKKEEGELGYFRLVFTLNQWSGVVPEFAVWGRINPRNRLFECFRNVQPLTRGDIVDAYIDTWYCMESAIGINKKVYMPNPSGGWRQFVV